MSDEPSAATGGGVRPCACASVRVPVCVCHRASVPMCRASVLMCQCASGGVRVWLQRRGYHHREPDHSFCTNL